MLSIKSESYETLQLISVMVQNVIWGFGFAFFFFFFCWKASRASREWNKSTDSTMEVRRKGTISNDPITSQQLTEKHSQSHTEKVKCYTKKWNKKRSLIPHTKGFFLHWKKVCFLWDLKNYDKWIYTQNTYQITYTFHS